MLWHSKILNLRKGKLSPKELEKFLNEVDLSSIPEWTEQEQQEVLDLITEYGFLFTLDNLDLGMTSIVKHTIKLTDSTPFKAYWNITPHQFEEAKKNRKC